MLAPGASHRSGFTFIPSDRNSKSFGIIAKGMLSVPGTYTVPTLLDAVHPLERG